MSPKQVRFVAEYLIDLNASEAAVRAGYSRKTARSIASELLTKPDIAAAVVEKQAKQLAKADLTAERVLEELRRLAFFDVAEFFDDSGNLKPVSDIPKEARAAIAGIEVARANLDPKDGKKSEEWLHKIKLAPKQASLEMLAKHFGLLIERVEHSGGIAITHEVPE